MSKLDELIAELCPNGVQYATMGELGLFYGGISGKKKEDFVDGNAKFITYKNVYSNPALNLDTNDRVKITAGEKQRTLEYGDVIFTGSSETPDECGISSVVTEKPVEPLYLNSFCFVFRFNDPTIILPDFSKHLFRSENLRYQIGKTASGVTRYNVSKKLMENVRFPVPPLEVQREIVRVLDSFTLLTARKKQYEFYRDQLLTFSENETRFMSIGELYPDIRNGFVGTVTPFFSDKENGVLYLRGTNIHNGIISNEDVVYVSRDFHSKHSRTELKSDDIIMVQSGHVGECAVVGEKYAGANCHALIVMSNGGKCNSKYIVYYFHSYEGKKKLDAITTGGTVKHILASKIKQVIVPVPPIEVQNRLVNVLDNFEAICNDLNIGLPAEIEARQKQYEYYRDLLLTFAETGSMLVTDRETVRPTDRQTDRQS